MLFRWWILVLLTQVKQFLADHYKGGSISWRPVSPYSLSSPVQVVITYRDSWALSRYACNDTTINTLGSYNDTTNSITASITCISSSAACTASQFTAISSTLYCTDFSTAFDVSTGSYYSKQNLALNSVIDIASRGASWSSEILMNAWSLVSHMDLTPISGKINSSPVSGSLPIIQFFVNELRVIQILASDWDSDQVVRCRWSYQSSTDECGSACFDLPNASLSPIDCAVTWTGVLRSADVANGLNQSTYVVSVTVEDFVNASSTTPLSSVPHQLLVQVSYQSVNACASRPSIGSFLLRNQACFAWSVGSTLVLTFYGSILPYCYNNYNHSIVAFVSSTPLNVQKGNIYRSSNYTWAVTISWTPTSDQVGLVPICAAAVDDYGQASDQNCVMIAVGATSFSILTPTFVQGTASPLGTTLSTQTRFSIQANLPLRRTKLNNTLIYIQGYDVTYYRTIDCKYSGDVYFVNKTLIFFVRNPSWTLGRTYYVNLGYGVATADQYCGTETYSLNGYYYWRFTIWDPQMSSTTTPPPTTTTATTHTVTTRVQGTTTYNTIFTTTGVPAYSTTSTTSTTATTSTSATTTTTTSATTTTTGTTTTTQYVPNAVVIYPKDMEIACIQPVAISAVIITSVMIPFHFLAMINLFVKMNSLQHKNILGTRRTYRKRLQKQFDDEQETLV
ncbi:unnamed protein product [Rotaria socialis]|uniref:Uncharacterized protein n=3 Tax=Rotaria socialis TaxID=392032 RepID=A0A818B0D9_9BILA|nr:unnamed protein product [Rotaria socialis]CAF4465438.1 unnamed protein product [Rotaria socialis]